jgi:hypothetical protein
MRRSTPWSASSASLDAPFDPSASRTSVVVATRRVDMKAMTESRSWVRSPADRSADMARRSTGSIEAMRRSLG